MILSLRSLRQKKTRALYHARSLSYFAREVRTFEKKRLYLWRPLYNLSTFSPIVTGTKCHSGLNIQWMFRLGQNVQWTFCQGTFHPGTKKITMVFLSYERIAIFQVKNKLHT